MPVLPSGRRIEFSMDRFHSLLARMNAAGAQRIAATLDDPDDLLFVLDAVHFSITDGTPYFAGYVAADWKTHAADWSTADRQSLQAWLDSPSARQTRAEAIDYVQALLGNRYEGIAYPYRLVNRACHPGAVVGAMSLQ